MASVSVAIMAHPKRADMVAELEQMLDRPAKVVWDERNDRWDTGRRSLLAFDPSATHHMVIQDDVMPSMDLVAGVERALEWVPDGSPMMCYIGRVRTYGPVIKKHLADNAGASWFTFNETYWGPCLVLPTADIEPLVKRCDRMNVGNYDRRIGLWYAARKRLTWAPWPSLVEHRDSPSLVAGRTGQRQAHSFLGSDVSALTVDWSGPVHHIPVGTRAR